jgi:regulator of cell morphogenesis and NO signaling
VLKEPGMSETVLPPAPESIPELVARVIDRHHAYLRRSLPEVTRLVAKIAEVHGPRVPELSRLQATVDDLRVSLENGMAFEETRLFPLLMSARDLSSTRDGLRTLEALRESVVSGVDRIRALTGDYQAPEGACRTWLRTLVELEDLENDLARHLALEDRLRALAAPRPA